MFVSPHLREIDLFEIPCSPKMLPAKRLHWGHKFFCACYIYPGGDPAPHRPPRLPEAVRCIRGPRGRPRGPLPWTGGGRWAPGDAAGPRESRRVWVDLLMPFSFTLIVWSWIPFIFLPLHQYDNDHVFPFSLFDFSFHFHIFSCPSAPSCEQSILSLFPPSLRRGLEDCTTKNRQSVFPPPTTIVLGCIPQAPHWRPCPWNHVPDPGSYGVPPRPPDCAPWHRLVPVNEEYGHPI